VVVGYFEVTGLNSRKPILLQNLEIRAQNLYTSKDILAYKSIKQVWIISVHRVYLGYIMCYSYTFIKICQYGRLESRDLGLRAPIGVQNYKSEDEIT